MELGHSWLCQDSNSQANGSELVSDQFWSQLKSYLIVIIIVIIYVIQAVLFCLLISPLDEVKKKFKC